MIDFYKKALRITIGLFSFLFGYILLNYTQLLHAVYYRYAAAHDTYNAAYNLAGLVGQGLLLLAICVFAPKILLLFVLFMISISAFIHLSYEQILGGYIDISSMTWILSETRQASNVVNDFLPSIVIATAKVFGIFSLFTLSRYLIRPLVVVPGTVKRPSSVVALALVLAATVGASETLRLANLPQGNETSAYTLAIRVLLDANPQREAVDSSLRLAEPLTKKVVWLVDESTSAQGVAKALVGSLQRHKPTDFGEVAAMGNCSAPSNAALRWGVNVLQVNARSDLRTAPTIWAYAKQAGYATTLIDGQVNGAPQNMVWEPERALIDNFLPAKGDIDTDFKIAKLVNELLKRPGSDFIYVVLRGAHYAYESNYPKDFVPAGNTLFDRYMGAIKYSKKDFFDALFLDVDRSQVAAIYTSDHGQHLEEGKVPHCTLKPSSDEYSVPLLAFLPLSVLEQLRLQTDFSSLSGRSHSQIFPTSLWLMGYDQNFAEENFDVLLNRPTNRYVWFGRSFVPHADTGLIEVHTSDKFPMR